MTLAYLNASRHCLKCVELHLQCFYSSGMQTVRSLPDLQPMPGMWKYQAFKNFHHIGGKCHWLYVVHSNNCFFLWHRNYTWHFSWAGDFTLQSNELKMWHKSLYSCSAHPIKTLGVTRSGPAALFRLTFFRALPYLAVMRWCTRLTLQRLQAYWLHGSLFTCLFYLHAFQNMTLIYMYCIVCVL